MENIKISVLEILRPLISLLQNFYKYVLKESGVNRRNLSWVNFLMRHGKNRPWHLDIVILKYGEHLLSFITCNTSVY